MTKMLKIKSVLETSLELVQKRNMTRSSQEPISSSSIANEGVGEDSNT